MKSFFKNVLACIVAFFIVGALLIGFFFIILIVGSISGESKVKVQDSSVLTLTSKTIVVDSPTEMNEGLFSMPSDETKVLVYDVVKAINAAKTDDKIKGISLEADFIYAGFTQLTNIREALEDFKKSGKFVYAYGNTVTQSGYYLSSVAQEYHLNPMGFIDLKGLSAEVVFFKNFIDKYGIGMDVLRHGQFKAAVEPFIENSISEENKEQLSTLLGDLWGKMSSEIAESRKISNATLQVTADSLVAILPEEPLRRKLVDAESQFSQYETLLKKKVGVKEDKKLQRISFPKYIKSIKDNEKSKESHVAVLYASGSIMNGEGSDNIYSTTFREHIQKLKDDDKVKAVVFRVNSPGGSANASEEILYELSELKKKKPLVISFGDYAASGGYYIAMAGDRIYSEPGTVTGSIGVFGMIPNMKELAERNGIRSDVVQTNSNALYHSNLQGLSQGARSVLSRSIEATYKRFVYWVTKNRKQSFEQIDAIGGGRVWSGIKAKELGLVDELGTLNDAVLDAAKRAKLSEYSVSSYPKKVSFYEELMKDLNSDQLQSKIIERKLGAENYKLFELLFSPDPQNKIMAESFYRIKMN